MIIAASSIRLRNIVSININAIPNIIDDIDHNYSFFSKQVYLLNPFPYADAKSSCTRLNNSNNSELPTNWPLSPPVQEQEIVQGFQAESLPD